MPVLKRSESRPPTHPERSSARLCCPHWRSRRRKSPALGISRHTLYQLLGEKARVTPEMAIRLGKLCGDGPEIWLAMQTKRDLWEAKRTVDTSAIPTLSAA